jgi:hypothetical protein
MRHGQQELALAAFGHRQCRRQAIERLRDIGDLFRTLGAHMDAAVSAAEAQRGIGRSTQRRSQPRTGDERDGHGDRQPDDQGDEQACDHLRRRPAGDR